MLEKKINTRKDRKSLIACVSFNNKPFTVDLEHKITWEKPMD